MPSPTRNEVHVDRPLTNVSVALMQDLQNSFVSGKVFPNVPVPKQSDVYYKYPREYFNLDQAQPLAPGAESSGGGYVLETDTYRAKVWAWHHDIPDQVEANADKPLNLEREATELVTRTLMIRKERDWASTFFTSGVWTGGEVTGDSSGSVGSGEVTYWNDQTSGTPIDNIRDAMTDVEEKTGLRPNTMVVGRKVFDALVDHPDIIDRIKFNVTRSDSGSPAFVTEQTLAALFGLDRILVSSGVYNNVDWGQAENHSFIMGKNALLVHTPRSPGLMTPAAGYTFTWNGYLGNGNDFGMAIRRYDEEMRMRHARRVEGLLAFDHKLVSGELGYFFNGIVE